MQIIHDSIVTLSSKVPGAELSGLVGLCEVPWPMRWRSMHGAGLAKLSPFRPKLRSPRTRNMQSYRIISYHIQSPPTGSN